jgi:hypothetical protein
VADINDQICTTVKTRWQVSNGGRFQALDQGEEPKASDVQSRDGSS